jgi:hypothetical protein
MLICSRHECQTTAGCAHRGPNGQLCFWPGDGCGSYEKTPGHLHQVGPLSAFTDEEIAREYHWRSIKKLGDPRVCVSCEPIKE